MDKKKEYQKKYCEEHKEQIRESQLKWRQRNKEKIRQYDLIYYQKNRLRALARLKRTRIKLKEDTLTLYGNGKLACVICGESRLGCLSIDHIGGGGNNHRRQLKKEKEKAISEKVTFAGWNFYRWLKNKGYPLGYRTLCLNCQFLEIRFRGESKTKLSD